MFQILDANINGTCGGLLPIVTILAKVVKIVHIFIPIALIVFGTFDLGKAVISSDDKKIKEAQGHLIKRVIYAIIIFLIPYLVSLIMSLVTVGGEAQTGDTGSYKNCWTSAWSNA